MLGSLKARSYGAQSRLSLIPLTLVVLFFLCEAAHVVNGFAYVPVLQSFAASETTGSKTQSALMCKQSGGYLATEPTAVLHKAVIESVRAAGAGETWYAFLGADTKGNALMNCPVSIQDSPLTSGVSYGCYWRWNQGWWNATDDNPSLQFYKKHIGVTFYVGNTWEAPASTFVNTFGAVSGFPNFFNTTASEDKDKRPGMMFGQDLIAVGVSDSATWSDNRPDGGYSYAGYTYSHVVGLSKWDAAAQAASKSNFWAACQTQVPSRSVFEMENTSSGLQKYWWVIYFVFLFVVMLVTFIVVMLCQDDEDMDEPPEDAPDWARQEMLETKRPKSFVSTRSFRGNNNYEDEGDDTSNNGGKRSRNGGDGGQRDSPLSDSDSRDNNQGRGYNSGNPNYKNNNGGYPTYTNPQEMRQVPSTSGSYRYQGRQNGGDDNEDSVRRSRNNWM